LQRIQLYGASLLKVRCDLKIVDRDAPYGISPSIPIAHHIKPGRVYEIVSFRRWWLVKPAPTILGMVRRCQKFDRAKADCRSRRTLR